MAKTKTGNNTHAGVVITHTRNDKGQGVHYMVTAGNKFEDVVKATNAKAKELAEAYNGSKRPKMLVIVAVVHSYNAKGEEVMYSTHDMFNFRMDGSLIVEEPTPEQLPLFTNY